MIKKLFALLLCFCILFTVCSCGKTPEQPSEPSSAPSDTTPENTNLINPLTGVQNFDPAKKNVRPMAIMIDNDSIAQKNTQSGISAADIVYETEAEGGITRLCAVFADIEKAPQLGDIRSARVVFINIARGHNAIFVHSGKDPIFAAELLKNIDNFELGTNYYAERITYGAAKSWQTLFSTGATIWKGLNEKKWKITQDSFPAWQSFAKESETVTLSNAANKLTCKFNSSSISYFTYDQTTGKYNKTSKHTENKDRNTGGNYAFENVVILQTSMSYYYTEARENYLRKIDLEGGSGYYATNGTYKKIKWKKGTETQPFVFMNEDGSPLKMSAGNTWVCIASNSSTITVE